VPGIAGSDQLEYLPDIFQRVGVRHLVGRLRRVFWFFHPILLTTNLPPVRPDFALEIHGACTPE
jgi:hypothetical protein